MPTLTLGAYTYEQHKHNAVDTVLPLLAEGSNPTFFPFVAIIFNADLETGDPTFITVINSVRSKFLLVIQFSKNCKQLGNILFFESNRRWLRFSNRSGFRLKNPFNQSKPASSFSLLNGCAFLFLSAS